MYFFIFMISIFLLGLFIYNKQKIENFGVNISYCSNCNNLWEGNCKDCNNCGWCVDNDYFGKCMPGDSMGPYNNKWCKKWFYNGNCTNGPECTGLGPYYGIPNWWIPRSKWWNKRDNIGPYPWRFKKNKIKKLRVRPRIYPNLIYR